MNTRSSLLALLAFVYAALAADVTINTPNAPLQAGSTVTLTFSYNPTAGNVPPNTNGNLVLMRGNGDFNNGVKVADIASGVQPNVGSVTWSVPSSLTNSNDYFLQWQWVGQNPSTFKYSGAFPVTGGSGSSSLSLTATATSTSTASSSATSVITATRTSTSEQTSTSTSGSPNRPTLDANVNSGAMGVNSGLLVGFVGTGVALVGGLGVVGLLL